MTSNLSAALGDLLPAAFGVAISPIPIIATVLMLLSQRARQTAPVRGRLGAGPVGGSADRARRGRAGRRRHHVLDQARHRAAVPAAGAQHVAQTTTTRSAGRAAEVDGNPRQGLTPGRARTRRRPVGTEPEEPGP